MIKITTKIILAICLFCLIQGIGSSLIFLVTTRISIGITSTDTMSFSLMTTGVMSCIMLIILKMIRPFKAFYPTSLDWKHSTLAFTAAISGIFALDLLGEQANLPDVMKQDLLNMANSGWGMLALGIVGPVVEELYFREGIQGYMHRNGVSPWISIIVASLCFGLIHFNPAQIPFACGIGIILGIIYFKTGNIILTSLIHIANNCIAVLEMRILGEEINNFSYQEALGGPLPTAIYIIGGAVLCLFLLRSYWKQACPPSIKTEKERPNVTIM